MNARSNILLIVLSVFLIAIMPSCEKDEPENPSNQVCNETISSPSYLNDIVPILESNCYRCHSNENNAEFAEGNDLEGFQDIFPYAKDGTLSGVVRQADGFIPMPLNGDRIALCDILKIEKWVDEGAMEN